ncbi:uncharacterized protein SPSK_06485 [Sporothrix schenckii 1099-18]|uniref:DUF7136 domain-containing protein n=1 Tax=Sporothrix schenckii 1099-18 TaxID=1397361 RepID=A0A0F2MJN9_SPOSC|nr:uncharacterized protein SPSK_06485 [Sporothrix schenckii 1099-18]KJR89279.1 hypothetical protein SPSK_06485 [Sporothrix schenckii 1099-18]
MRMRLFSDPAGKMASVLAWSSVAYAALANAAVSTRVAKADMDISPGVVNVDLVFPLNNTYAAFDGAMPIVFALSRPDIGSVLQLRLSYRLFDLANEGVALGEGQVVNLSSDSGPVPQTKNNGDGEYAFFVHFSEDSIAGRIGQFLVELTLVYVVDYPGDKDVPSSVVQVPLMYDMIFTTRTGAPPAVVPGMNVSNSGSGSNSSTPSSCALLGAASFYYPINITSFVAEKGIKYGVVSTDKTRHLLPPCAVRVDPDTGASIAAGSTQTTAAATSTGATGSPTATPNAALSGRASTSNIVATVSVTAAFLSFYVCHCL